LGRPGDLKPESGSLTGKERGRRGIKKRRKGGAVKCLKGQKKDKRKAGVDRNGKKKKKPGGVPRVGARTESGGGTLWEGLEGAQVWRVIKMNGCRGQERGTVMPGGREESGSLS